MLFQFLNQQTMLKLKKNYSIVFLVVLVLSLSKYVLVIEDVAASTNRNFAPMCDTLIVQISNNSPICMGNMATLTANGGNTYSWSNGSDTSNISVATAGVYTVTATDASGCTGVASTNVVINSLPTATAANTSPACYGGMVVLQATGGASYAWSGPAGSSNNQNVTINNVNSSASGIYIVTVTNSNGCTSTASTTITLLPALVITASNTSPVCSGEAVTLSATGGVSYTWSGAAGSFNGQTVTIPNVNNTNNGVYTVTVTNANGCTKTATTIVALNNPYISINGNASICSGTTTTLTANSTGASAYLWNTGNTTNTLNAVPIGTYTVTVTNIYGCTSSAIRTVTAISLSMPNITGGNTNVCVGSVVNLKETTNQPIYNWSTGDNVSSIFVTPTTNTVYTVTVSNTCGATATASTYVNVTSCTISTPGTQCQNATALCTNTPLIFSANVNNGTAQSGNDYGCLGTQPNPSWCYLNIAEPGAIHISETNSANTDIDFALWGPFPSLAAAANQCGSLPAPIDCSYSPQANEQIDVPDSSQIGNVFLLLFSNYGNANTTVYTNKIGGTGETYCPSIDCSDVTVGVTNVVNATCNNGGGIQISASGGTSPYTALWSNGATTGTISNLSAGTYTVSVTDSYGCIATTIATVNNTPIGIPSNTTTLNLATTSAKLKWTAVTGAANYTIKIRKAGTINWTTVAVPTGTSKTINTLLPCTGYEWKVRANCAGGSEYGAFTAIVTFSTMGCSNDAKTDDTTPTFSLQPNPANSLVTLNYFTDTNSQINIKVMDMTGRIVLQQNTTITEGDNNIDLPTNNLPQGYYVVEANDGTTQLYQKLLIVR
jgi:hypothetical protein